MSYSSEVLADSPIAFYSFDETSGDWQDLSGNGNHLTPGTGVTRSKAGIVDDGGSAVSGSGSATIGHRTSSVTGVGFAGSQEVWIRTGPTVNAKGAFTKIGGNGNGWDVGIGNNRADQLGNKLVVGRNGLNWHGTGFTIQPNSTYHIVVTFDGSNAGWKAYVNGVDIGWALSGTIGYPSSALHVGDEEETNFLSSSIDVDAAAFYNTALSSGRVAAHYAAGDDSVTVAGGHVSESTTVNAGAVVAGALVAGGTVSESTAVYAGTVVDGSQPVTVAGGHIAETTTVRAGVTSAGGAVVVEGGHIVEDTFVNPGTVDPGYTGGVTNNAVDGRGNRAQAAEWEWEPAPAPVPAGLSVAHEVVTALALTEPTITNGRPVVTVEAASAPRDRYRILVGNKDITFFRGTPTPPLDYQLVEPLMYGPATLSLPQVFAAFENPGEGDLKWLQLEKPVKLQRVDADGNVTATDYRGIILAFDTSGSELRVEIGGEVTGRAALMEKQIPFTRNVQDIGQRAYFAMRACNVDFKPHLGPQVGIEVARFGGVSHLDYLHRLCGLAFNKTGAQWSIMPDDEGTYRMKRKDRATVHATIYPHDEQLPADLRRDIAEEPNVIYGTGVTPKGMRVLNGVYPGMVQGDPPQYPIKGGGSFGEGTTNADTRNGSGITAMIRQLLTFGYISVDEVGGQYDADVVDAVEALQEDAGLPVTGVMNKATWNALYDLDKTGFTMQGAQIEPMAQRAYTRRWRRTASGAISGRNPNFDRSRIQVHRNIDFGVGFKRQQMRKWARAELDDRSDNWVGTITLETGAVIRGEHTPGAPIAEADVMPAEDVKPGMNVSLPLFMGGILAHVSAVSVSDRKVTLTVDTRARDTLPVWEVIRRNRESRRNPHRAWIRDHLSSGNVKDAVTEFSEVGGLLGDDVSLHAGKWRVFEVPVGRAGTVGRLRLELSNPCEFAVAIFGQNITAGKLNHLIGNPLSENGRANWQKESVLNKLDRDHILLYTAGGPDNPCGYWPKDKGEGTDPTGKWQDDAGFEYRTGPANVLRVAVYAKENTKVKGGRVMWPRLEPGT